MTWNNFVEKIVQTSQSKKSNVVLRMNPQFEKLPIPITRFDDPFLPFGKAIINATQDYVCAYLFDLASYLAMGAAGAVALERTIAYAGTNTLKILHGSFTGKGYSPACDATGFGVDALTLSSSDDLQYYLENPPHAAFVTRMGNVNLQSIPEQGGYYWIDNNLVTLRASANILQLSVTDDKILYVSKFDNFAEDVARAIQDLS